MSHRRHFHGGNIDEVALTCHLPDRKLAARDIGAVVLVYREGKGHELGFTTLDGQTIAASTLRPDQVRPVLHHEIAHARTILT